MLFPKSRDIVREATAGTPKTSQVRGVATGDSSDGSVSVILDTVAGGENAEMTVPTAGGITEGSDVIVTLLDGTPVEVDQPGSIDNANARIDVLPDQIISTVSETYATKDEALNTASGSGRSITTTDAAGLPLRDLTVYGESVQDGTPTPDAPVEIRTVSGVNLLPLTEASVSANGVHATIKSDGTIELSGTATAKVTLTLNGRNDGDPYGAILPKGNYYYTTCEGTTADIWLSVQLKNLSTGGNVYTDNKGTDVSAYRSVDMQLRWVYLQVTSGTNCDGVVLKPAIYQNGKRPWVSYGNLLTTAGKNLIRVQDSTATFTNAYHVQFTATDKARPVSLFELEAGTTYTLSMDVESSVEPFNMSIGCGNGTYARDIASKENNSNGRISITFTPSAAQLAYGKYLAFRAPRYSTTKTFTYSVSNVQLEIGSTATDYEPYRESTAYIDLQGNVLASLPDGTKDVLHVENGRAWIDAATAITTTATTDGITATVGVDAMSTTGDLSDGATVIYAATPSTIDLGEVSLPTVQDGDTVRVIAEVAPEFDTSWWRDTAIVGGMEHAQNTADSASSGVTDLRVYTDSRLEQTSRDITATFTESIEAVGGDVDGITERVSTIENTVKISSEGVTIAASDSPITANLDNDGLTFKAGDEAVLTLNAQTSTAEADRVSIGHYQWREMGDNAIALVWIGA